MLMNNKGFTLVELLAVIVILITILLVAIPNVSSTLERKKEKDLELKKESVISAGEVYVSNNKKNIDYNGYLNNNCGISIDKLFDNNLITKEEYNTVKNKGYLYVKKSEIVNVNIIEC